MMKMLGHRIADQRVLRLVKRFLKSGVMEQEQIRASDEGVPQGGSISPVLANVYLHYALDLWFEKVYRKSCKGKATLLKIIAGIGIANRSRANGTAVRRKRRKPQKYTIVPARIRTRETLWM